jgi:hypothetical protein
MLSRRPTAKEPIDIAEDIVTCDAPILMAQQKCFQPVVNEPSFLNKIKSRYLDKCRRGAGRIDYAEYAAVYAFFTVNRSKN